MLAQNTVTVKKEELELTRHNVTPAQFLAYVRRQIKSHKLTAILPEDIDLDYFAAGNDLNFDIRHEGDDLDGLHERSISKPYEMQTYLRNEDGTVYNLIMEFQHWDDKTGVGYFYFLNTWTEDETPAAEITATEPETSPAEITETAETAVADAVSDGSARVFDLEIIAIDDEDPSAFSWYYHDADAGEYHAIRRQSKPARGYRAALEIDPETGDPRTYSGLLPTKAAALAVLHHLAPDAVELPGLPAWLR